MLPLFLVPDVANLHTGDTQYGPDFSGRKFPLQGADFDNFGFGQLGVFMNFSSNWIVASLIVHVSDIVCLCAKKEMLRPNTWGIIAFVQHEHAFWDSAIMYFPRDSVCSVSTFIKTYQAVIKRLFRASPYPAMVGLFNVVPEIFLQRLFFEFCGAAIGAEFAFGIFKIAGPYKELLVTVVACSGNARWSWHKSPPACLPTSSTSRWSCQDER